MCENHIEFKGAFKIGAGTVLLGGEFGNNFEVDVGGNLGQHIITEANVKLGKNICVENGVHLREDPRLAGNSLAVRLTGNDYTIVQPIPDYYFDFVDDKCVQKRK